MRAAAAEEHTRQQAERLRQAGADRSNLASATTSPLGRWPGQRRAVHDRLPPGRRPPRKVTACAPAIAQLTTRWAAAFVLTPVSRAPKALGRERTAQRISDSTARWPEPASHGGWESSSVAPTRRQTSSVVPTLLLSVGCRASLRRPDVLRGLPNRIVSNRYVGQVRPGFP
jgi:hypothetical protein